jgi:hypothetical protein
MKSLLFTAILSLRERSEQLLIKFAILLQIGLTHAQTFFRGVGVSGFVIANTNMTLTEEDKEKLCGTLASIRRLKQDNLYSVFKLNSSDLGTSFLSKFNVRGRYEIWVRFVSL